MEGGMEWEGGRGEVGCERDGEGGRREEWEGGRRAKEGELTRTD